MVSDATNFEGEVYICVPGYSYDNFILHYNQVDIDKHFGKEVCLGFLEQMLEWDNYSDLKGRLKVHLFQGVHNILQLHSVFFRNLPSTIIEIREPTLT